VLGFEDFFRPNGRYSVQGIEGFPLPVFRGGPEVFRRASTAWEAEKVKGKMRGRNEKKLQGAGSPMKWRQMNNAVKGVVRIVLSDGTGSGFFLNIPELGICGLVSNNHILSGPYLSGKSFTIELNVDPSDARVPVDMRVDPSAFFCSSPEGKLDATFIQVDPT
jgi:hypothetical protein